jgi:ferric-dicitrate binding protein FerR (iron transport regulator)
LKIPEDRIWILLARKFSNSITKAEEAELMELLRGYSDAQYTFEILKKIWEVPPVSDAEGPNLYLNDFRKIQDKENQIAESIQDRPGFLKKFRSDRRNIRRLMIAVSVLLMSGALAYMVLYMFSGKSKAGINDVYTISTKAGERRRITLPDGTKVWLNVASSLGYSADFVTDSVREIKLTGEAYFEVKHDEKHPFIIQTGNMKIRDIGTTFNVKSYPGEASTEAALISGIIEVTVSNNPERNIRLKPREKIVVYRNKRFKKFGNADSMNGKPPVQDIQVSGYRIMKIKQDSAIQTFPETAWMQNDFVFKNQIFEDLAKAMGRRYAVKIVIKNDRIRQYQLTGILKNETLKEALMELQIIAPFKYIIKDSVVTIF